MNFERVGWHDWANTHETHLYLMGYNVFQGWSMFSPQPPATSWYYLMVGVLDNGTTVELWANEGLHSWEYGVYDMKKPEYPWSCFKNHRWFKYFEMGYNVADGKEKLRLYFGSYLCRNFNERHHNFERLHYFVVYYMAETVDPEKPNQPKTIHEKNPLWQHVCYDKPVQYLKV